MQQNYGEIKAEGAELIAISVESIGLTKHTTENNNLTYIVLSDGKREATALYNVFEQPLNKISRAVTFIIDTDGTIAWKSLDKQFGRVPTATTLVELKKLNE